MKQFYCSLGSYVLWNSKHTASALDKFPCRSLWQHNMGTSYNPRVNFLVNEGLCSNIFKPTHHSLIKFCSSKWSYLVTSFKHILGEIKWRHNCISQIADFTALQFSAMLALRQHTSVVVIKNDSVRLHRNLLCGSVAACPSIAKSLLRRIILRIAKLKESNRGIKWFLGRKGFNF